MADKKYRYPPAPPSGRGTFSDDLVGLQLTDGGGLTQGNFEFSTNVVEKVNRTFNTGVFSNPISLNDLDFEKWAKLKVRDLYKYDIVSPFRYYMFTWNLGVGVMPFYFRGQNIKSALKSFAFNHKRVTSGNYEKKLNYKTFVEDFYNFSTRVLGLNANPLGINADNRYWYNADRFLREAGFFEDVNPKKVFEENTYYKRRELVV